MGEQKNIIFDSVKIEDWARTISEAHKSDFAEEDIVVFQFDNMNDKEITPAHIVSLACLIEYLDKLGCKVKVPAANINTISDYIITKLRFKEYWQRGKHHVVALKDNVFNLWRIVDSEKDTYSILVLDYLKKIFHSKDLSAVHNSLVETFYNIFDHAQADGNAFTFVEFNKSTQELYVAACDFGIGIVSSVRSHLPEITSDRLAIEKALEYNFTTKSKIHNKGMGLGNIKDTCTDEDLLTIISGNGQVVANYETLKSCDNNFSFPGTLIYYNLTLSHFEDEEVLDNFEL